MFVDNISYFLWERVQFSKCISAWACGGSFSLFGLLIRIRTFIWVETENSSGLGGTQSTGSNEIFEMDFIKDPSIRKAIMIICYFTFHYGQKKKEKTLNRTEPKEAKRTVLWPNSEKKLQRWTSTVVAIVLVWLGRGKKETNNRWWTISWLNLF